MTYSVPALRQAGESWRALIGRARPPAPSRLSPTVRDVLLAAVFCLATLGVSGHTVRAVGWREVVLFQALLTLPLIRRRRAPLTVFGCIAAAAAVQWLADIQLVADSALLIALYTVAAYGSRRRALLAFGVLEFGAVLATVRWTPHERWIQSFTALSAMAIAAAVIGVNMQTRRAYFASLEDRAVRLELERAQRDRLAAAGERARISREMHDVVTHNLSVMVALADAAVYAQQHSPEKVIPALRQIAGTGRQALTDMRRSLGVLRDGEPDAQRHPLPGLAQLEPLADQVRAAGLPTRLKVSGDPTLMPAAAQLTVYRIVQEALTNTLKHTPQGTRAAVLVDCTSDHVTVIITDDGGDGRTEPPPAAGSAVTAPGHGLDGMRERVTAYGGTLEADPMPGGGWRVAARFAFTEGEEDTP